MKKAFPFYFGLLIGIALCLLLFQFGFDLFIEHLKDFYVFYIIICIVTLIVLPFVYFKLERTIVKQRNTIPIYNSSHLESLSDLSNRKELIKFGVTNVQHLKYLYAKWVLMNWTFRTIHIIILGFVGVFGSILIWNQNTLLSEQNNRLDQQTYLQEAERRSSLVFLFSSIMDEISSELELDIGKKDERDLSTQLIARISALSNNLKPYKFLDGDTLIAKKLSPERGQLLIALLGSKLEQSTLDDIYTKTSFEYADLRDVKILNGYLKGARLNFASFDNSSIIHSTLDKSKLRNASFKGTIIQNIFTQAAIKTSFNGADLSFCDFENSWLLKIDFKGSNLNTTSFRKCRIDRTYINHYFTSPIDDLRYEYHPNEEEPDIEFAKVDSNFFEFHPNFDGVYKIETTIERGITLNKLKRLVVSK